MRIGNWEINKITDRITVSELLLMMVATVGVVSLSLVAGNAIQLLKKRKKYYRPGYLDARLKSLIKQGLLKKEIINGEKIISLTAKGERELAVFKYRQNHKGKKVRWDGKWRVVIFDIKEKHRKIRDELRIELTEVGFKQLQQSVWVTPYDCSKYVEMIKAELNTGYSVIFLVVEYIDQAEQVKMWFNLK